MSLYSPFLTPQERQDNALIPVSDLTSELNMLRVLTARYLGSVAGRILPLEEIVVNADVMHSLARLMAHIALVLNAHLKLNPALASIAEEVEEGLTLTRQFFGLLQPEELLLLSPSSSPLSPQYAIPRPISIPRP